MVYFTRAILTVTLFEEIKILSSHNYVMVKSVFSETKYLNEHFSNGSFYEL